jgi:hypothetical protein
MTISRGRLVFVVVLAAAVGWMANDWMTPAGKKRPVLTFIRNWWWVPLLLDEPKPEDTSRQIGPDGYRLVHHGRSL